MAKAAKINAEIQAARDKAGRGQGIVVNPTDASRAPAYASGHSNVSSGQALSSAQSVG